MCCMMGHHEDHESGTESTAPSESLLDVLRRRYALGEITQAQLDEMKTVLGLSDGKAVGTAAGRSNPWEVEHHG